MARGPRPREHSRRHECDEETAMIARLWHGVTTRQNAGAYETLRRNKVLPGIHRVSGYGGAYLLKRTGPEGVECVTVTLCESLNAGRGFAASDYAQAVVR